jgi:hypothetical protein
MLIIKYKSGEINKTHVKDIKKNDKLRDYGFDVQLKTVNDIIQNRNIINWYNEVIRTIDKLQKYLDVDKDNLFTLSSKKTELLELKVKELKDNLNAFASTLESIHNKSCD